MSKYLAMLLVTQLTTSSTIVSPIINNSVVKNLVTNFSTRPYYKNIHQSFVDTSADVRGQNVGSNGSHTTATGTIFNWKDYADSWDDFKNNYGAINVMVEFDIAFNWYHTKWVTSELYIPLDNITLSGNNWVTIHEEVQTTTQTARWDACHAKLSYDCWINGNSVCIHFKLDTWATNHYDNYYYSIMLDYTNNVTCNATFDYNTINSLLNQHVNNQTLNLESNYSTAIQDSQNWPLINSNIQQMIKNALGNYYQTWKPIIYPIDNPWSYSNQLGQVSQNIKFNDPNTNQQVVWPIKINVNLKLSGEYWNKTLKERLHITPGKVVNPNDPNGAMIDDTPLIPTKEQLAIHPEWNGKEFYSTTAYLTFTGSPDENDTMKINGQDIQVINDQFNFDMTDQQQHTDDKGTPVNQYNILLEKHDALDFSHILGNYEVTYVIKQDIPNLLLKWHAWDPSKNQDQNDLIQPTIDGKPNDKYDKEVNEKTGTKTQIMWVKHQAENHFPLDPLNQQGEIISDGKYDQGFIAEGSVSGMGIEQSFNDPWIKTVNRELVSAQHLTSTSEQTTITSDEKGRYFSHGGVYHYTITDQQGFAANKFMIIGQDYQDKYAKFLDVLNNPSTAVDFWTTLQGLHLKYYLARDKALDSRTIQSLSFNQVARLLKGICFRH